MPITFTRLESRVYHVQLSGEIPLHELIAMQNQGLREAQKHDDGSYVLIVEVAPNTRMPFDIRQAGHLIQNDGSLAVLSVGATFYMKFVVSVLARIFNLGHIEHFPQMNQAVYRARELLQTHVENDPR